MTYSGKGLEAIQQKDKRIAFLAIFRDVITKTEDIDWAYDKAVELVERIFKKYPFPESTTAEKTTPDWASNQTKKVIKSEIENEVIKEKRFKEEEKEEELPIIME